MHRNLRFCTILQDEVYCKSILITIFALQKGVLFDLMQDEVKYRTSLVSKSLPIKKLIFAIYSNSATKAIQYAWRSET